ncbi:MAG: S1 RNA-binding domain-containing protein [Planctomycetaceae bacterium]|jgi:small subunit ribosomal protein S1|nr:S1 RNA-binding domain-containing protein [Planctomycetaceae bacterium]
MSFSDETVDPVNTSDNNDSPRDHSASSSPTPPRQRILIGSQRNPDAYRSASQQNKPAAGNENGISSGGENSSLQKPPLKTGQVVFDSEIKKSEENSPQSYREKNLDSGVLKSDGGKRNSRETNFKDYGDNSGISGHNVAGNRSPEQFQTGRQSRKIERQPPRQPENDDDDIVQDIENKPFEAKPLRSHVNVPAPTIRGELPDDLQEEYEKLFNETELGAIFGNIDQVASQALIETETKQTGKIALVGKENVFVDLGGREQGAVPLKQFKENPTVGETIEVIVVRFLIDDGLYELSLPLAASDVTDWSQIETGMIVEAKITGHNVGGLECEVNKLRGFIPMSQISTFRVEDAQPFVGQKLSCIVTECNPSRRNLVLSHRALLEKENEENRQKLLSELEIGQTRDGLVRKLIDTGAFVDLGGIDGFLPIGALAWGRVRHPSDVISEGQRIRVQIVNIDVQKNRISLNYRDETSDPWLNIENTFPENTKAHGKVTRVMDFGAFVELTPGVEGLVHISELSLKRVNRVSDVVQEGDSVDVLVTSVDKINKRIALSMKQLTIPPEPEQIPTENAADETTEMTPGKTTKIKNLHKGPLKGGLGGKSDGGKFGLKF